MSVGQGLTVQDLPIVWGRASGLELLGGVQDSGLREATYLVRREDGQVIQLSELLYLVLAQIDPARSPAEVASTVSAAFGRELTVEGLDHLLQTRLAPLGLAAFVPIGEDAISATSQPHGPGATARPLLSLSLRGTLLPASWVRRTSVVLASLYSPFLVLGAIVAVVVMDIGLLGSVDLVGALQEVLTVPALLVGLYVLLTLGALVHELGHAAACARGGGRPGSIGFGVYVLFPAFYTDVTDSYRLGRRDRLRTDLGGLYFNVLTLILLGVLYRWTGDGVYVLALVLMHIEMVQQLVPVVRLDGYYVLADLAGVPDLFARVGPVLRSLRPGATPDPRVAELRPRARRVVVAWVLFVVPTLVAALAWLLWNLPFIVTQTIDALRSQLAGLAAAWRAGDPALVLLGVASVVLLVIPLLGLAVLAVRALSSTARTLARTTARTAGRLTRRPFMTESSAEESTMRIDPDPPTPASSRDAFLDNIWAADPDEYDEPVPSRPPLTKEQAQPIPTGATPATSPASAKSSPTETDHSTSTHRPGPPMTAADFDPAGTAAEFCDAIMLPPRTAEPQRGWRRAVYRASAGTLNPGPGAAERRLAELEERLRRPIDGSRRVVVMSRKGGVGKTTISFALGSTFSDLRGDRTIAVDANPDAGNLAHRVSTPNARTVTDVLRDLDRIDRYAALRSYTSQAPESRLEVLASDEDPRIGMALDRDDYHRLIELLDRFYNLILLDTGTGILDSANQGLLAEADQLVLVLRAGLDGGRAAALTLDWLDEHGYDELVQRAVVVVNAVRKDTDTEMMDAMVRHFERRCQRVVKVPWDPALELGAQTRLSRLAPATRASLVEMAAAVADGFDETGAPE